MVVVRAETDIKAGTEVTISYTDALTGNSVRREAIRDLWYFLCSCDRCEDVTELGTYVSAVRCRLCMKNEKLDSSAYMLPNNKDLNADWHCSQCENVVSNKTMVTLIKELQIKVKEKDLDLASIDNLIIHFQEF